MTHCKATGVKYSDISTGIDEYVSGNRPQNKRISYNAKMVVKFSGERMGHLTNNATTFLFTWKKLAIDLYFKTYTKMIEHSLK